MRPEGLVLARPITMRWDGEAMRPVEAARKLADELYVVGQVYRLAEEDVRSKESHSHEFAWLHTAWKTLPEKYGDQFPTSEHLRKRALIDNGFFDETIIDAGTNAAALRVAAYARRKDEFALVAVRGPIVVERVAKSQSHRAMGREDFQKSKQAILETVSAMLGITPEELQREAA